MIFKLDLPIVIVFGPGGISKIGEEAAKLGKKALIVTYPDIRRIGLLDKVINNLKEKGVQSVVFEKVEPNPRTTTVDEGAATGRKEGTDLIIGLGGGSVMDAAKGIALSMSGTASIWDYMTKKAEIKSKNPPIIQIPTMAGTGSEINGGAVITNWELHIKGTIGHGSLMAKVAIIDPEITLTVPLHQTKAGAIDTFAHLVENYLSDGTPTPLTDGIRETCMKMVVKYMPRVMAKLDDLEARTELSWASTIAMSQLARLGSGGGSMTCHGIEHAVSGLYDVTHGDGLAALLPAWMRSFQQARAGRFKSLAKNVFSKDGDGIKATEEFFKSVSMNIKLRDLGCKLEDADKVADLAVKSSPWLSTHPTPLDAKAIAKIYREAF